MSKLNDTHNLLDLYTHHCGQSEVPSQFHLWACISLIAACVADRVWFPKFRSSKLYPNLFTLFLGPSAAGKGEAVATMMRYGNKDRLPIVGTYAGNATAQYILKHLARRKEDDDGNLISGGKMFLVLEELAMSVGDGPIAKDFVKHMTGLFKGGDYPLEKGTITGGHVSIKDHCINILIGTNIADAIECIPKSAIAGGFLGRLVIIAAKYDTKLRITRPRYPQDYEEISEHLHERFRLLTQYEGEFTMSRAAERIEDHWYQNRPEPEDEAMLPLWRREHDLSLKLAMILALAETLPDDPLLIRGRHMEQAQQMTLVAHKAAPLLHSAAHQTRDSEHLDLVRRYIERAGTIQRSALQRKLSAKGILKDRMDDAIGTLVTEGAIVAKTDGRAMTYRFEGRRIRG